MFRRTRRGKDRSITKLGRWLWLKQKKKKKKQKKKFVGADGSTEKIGDSQWGGGKK